jgi:hypothetical protein
VEYALKEFYSLSLQNGATRSLAYEYEYDYGKRFITSRPDLVLYELGDIVSMYGRGFVRERRWLLSVWRNPLEEMVV